MHTNCGSVTSTFAYHLHTFVLLYMKNTRISIAHPLSSHLSEVHRNRHKSENISLRKLYLCNFFHGPANRRELPHCNLWWFYILGQYFNNCNYYNGRAHTNTLSRERKSLSLQKTKTAVVIHSYSDQWTFCKNFDFETKKCISFHIKIKRKGIERYSL